MASLRPSRTAIAGIVIGAVLALGVAACSPVDTSMTTPGATDSAAGRPSASATPTATATITIAGVDVDGQHVTVAGFVAGVVENSGSCTFIFSNDATSAALKLTSAATANVSTTTCGTQQEPIASFVRGAWHVRLSYKSSKIAVTSPSVEMQVP